MIYLFLFLLVFMQNLSAIEVTKENPVTQHEPLRMGFNHGKHALSVLFPKEFPLRFADLEEGKQIYYVNAHDGDKTTTYQFAYLGFGLEGLPAFKDKYLESMKTSFLKKNPSAKCNTVLDETEPNKNRTILDHRGVDGNRILFVGDFRSIDGKIYLVSEIIEVEVNDTREALAILDESFLDSFKKQNN